MNPESRFLLQTCFVGIPNRSFELHWEGIEKMMPSDLPWGYDLVLIDPPGAGFRCVLIYAQFRCVTHIYEQRQSHGSPMTS